MSDAPTTTKNAQSAEPMEWGFRYQGPLAAKTDPNCATCLAKMQEKCPTHGTNWTKGCAHCAHAKGDADCMKHHGLAASMKHAESSGAVPPGALADFQGACAEVLSEVSGFDPSKEVDLVMRGMRDPKTRRRERTIELVGR